MFGPEYTGGCPSCSAIADGFNGVAVHLENHDVAMIAVSRAPIDHLLAYKRRMGWTFPWASSLGSDFNFDFNISFTEDQQSSGSVDYNYRPTDTTWLWERGEEGGAAEHAAMCGTDRATYTREQPGVWGIALHDRVHVPVAGPGAEGAQRDRGVVPPAGRVLERLERGQRRGNLPGSRLAPAAGLLEDVAHDRSMHGIDCGPYGACGRILLLHEGGEQQRVLLALEEQLGRHPDARAGSKQDEVGGTAPHLPAEHESVRPSATEPQAKGRPPRQERTSHDDRGVLQGRSGPLLARPALSRGGVDKEGILVVDVGERAERSRGRRHRDLAHAARRKRGAPEKADGGDPVHGRNPCPPWPG